jgi:hypothetical protein
MGPTAGQDFAIAMTDTLTELQQRRTLAEHNRLVKRAATWGHIQRWREEQAAKLEADTPALPRRRGRLPKPKPRLSPGEMNHLVVMGALGVRNRMLELERREKACWQEALSLCERRDARGLLALAVEIKRLASCAAELRAVLEGGGNDRAS